MAQPRGNRRKRAWVLANVVGGVALIAVLFIDVTTVNQLYLPVNKPIVVTLKSKDVIHSFGVPEFRVKQDAIPGLTIPIWFVANVTTAEMRSRTGKPEFQYEIACAQLCGLGHAKMRGFVTVLPADEFQKWLDDKIKEQNAPDPFK